MLFRSSKFFENKSDADVEAYWAEKNVTSIVGLPAVDTLGRSTPA